MYSGGGNNRLASGMESAVEKVKAKFPKFADKIDAGILSLQKRIDLDGSFAAQEETQQQLLLQAQQRYTEAMNQRAARMAAGETDLPEITPESVLEGPELAVFNADRDAQDKANKKELKRQNRQKLAGKALGAGMIATTALGVASSMGGPVGEFAQGAMPIAGYFIGISFAQYVQAFDHWIAFFLLSGLGAKMIYEAYQNEFDDEVTNLTNKTLITLGIATSIDAMAIGVTFAFLQTDIYTAASVIGLVTFVLCVAAIYIGKKLGSFLESKAEMLGGLILIGLGCKILAEHLGLI
jgi:putative Mn2+ efflux pump MntP